MADGEVVIETKLDEEGIDEGIEGIGRKLKGFGDGPIAQGIGIAIGEKIVNGILAGLKAAAGLVSESLNLYSEQEQLVGGIEKLYGEAATVVEQNAASAYSRMGMSANEYMSNAMQYSAVLKASLGGDAEAAAAMTDQALMQIADNANVFGTNMEEVTQAYQSMSRGNYAMLDSLRLGYGGTKSEMERMLADAEAIKAKNGEVVDYSLDNFADIVEAIGVIQDEMGITGTTANEAAGTIEGSVASMKAAWQNWLTGLGDENADMGALTDQLISSVETAAANVMPRVVQIVGTIVDQLPGLLSKVFDAIPELFGKVAAKMEGSASPLVQVIGNIAGRISQLSGDQLESIAKTAAMGAAFLAAASSVSKLISPIASLAGIVPRVVSAFTTANPVMLAVVAATAALAAGIAILVKKHQDAEKHSENLTTATEGMAAAVRDSTSLVDQGKASMDEYSGSVEVATRSNEEFLESQARHVEAMQETNAAAQEQIDDLETARATIEALAGQTGLSAEEQGRLRAAVDTVNESCGTQYQVIDAANGVIADETGATEGCTQAIYDNIAAREAQIQVEAMESNLAEAYDAQREAQEQVNQAQLEYNDAKERQASLEAQADEWRDPKRQQQYNAAMEQANRDLAEAEQNLSDAQASAEECDSAVGNLETELGLMSETAQGTATGFEALVGSNHALSDMLARTGTDTDQFIANLQRSGASVEDLSNLTQEQWNEMIMAYDGSAASIASYLDGMGTSLGSSKDAFMEYLDSIDVFPDAADDIMGVTPGLAQAFSDLGISVDALKTLNQEDLQAIVTAWDNGQGDISGICSEYGLTMTDSLAGGIEAGTPGVESAAAGASAAQGAAQNTNGPTWGSAVTAGIAAGMSGRMSLISAAAATAKSAQNADKSGEGWTWGSHLVGNIAAGIRSRIDELRAAAQEAAQAQAASLHQSVADEGPLRYTDKWGGHLIDNIVAGLHEGTPRLAREAGHVADTIAGIDWYGAGSVYDSASMFVSHVSPSQGVSTLDTTGLAAAVAAGVRSALGGSDSLGVYLDGRTLVGHLIGDIDRRLGTMQASAERGL